MSDSLCHRTAGELVALIRTREASAREVVQVHLEQIERLNPEVNALVSVDPERALAAAAEADERLASGAEVGPLHGLPIAHKDTHDTAGIRTTYGSPLLADNVPDRDELVVERLKAAGTVVVGKTNVPEFAAGSHTFNPVFGTTANPYARDRSAGGSSGGAAAALACRMQPLADGSDMGGSLRNPASFNNVVGLRPAPGRVPTWPDAAAWSTLSVQGPMARTVSDAALMLSVIAGPDDRSPLSISEPGSVFDGPLDSDLSGLRVAFSLDLGGDLVVDPQVRAVLEPTAQVLADLGGAVEEAWPDLTGADEVFRTLRAWQFELALGELRDAHPERIKPSLRDNIDAGRALTGADVGRAERLHTELYHRVREFFTRYDVLALPVSQVPPFDVELEFPTEIGGVAMSSYLDWMRSAYWISATGCPAISVPAGFTPEGLPVGLQLVGPHRSERRLLEIAHAFEHATQHVTTLPAVATR
ncbi:amidase [Saccharopolyspora rhizosphaerae]|uniref:Amidase n=1 Tax=Saccharopolyspora rhizosphaerae TaxID=2492662 RepID=A0A3R8PAD4_9PSEU|nr:amidase [Saccharopolyspora rhizosphaerae]RRO19908.1 amidase [Saccharopolyspora rhizosphaerae]